MEVFEYIVDLFFPRQNSNYSSIHEYLSDKEIASQSPFLKVLEKDQQEVLENIFVAANLKDRLVVDLVHRAKFNLEYAIAKDLAKMVLLNSKKMQKIPSPELIIPVPSDPKRFLQRGYHLPSLLGGEISKTFEIDSLEMVKKPKSTTQQTLLDRKNRLVNLKDKFELVDSYKVDMSKFSTVWLVDDITTTGVTLTEVAKVLKAAFPFLKIFGVVVASNY